MFIDMLIICAIPVALTVYLFRNNWKQMAFGVTCIILMNLLMVWGASYSLNMDTEILNGKVTGKHRETVSCSHSYSCHPHTVCSGSGKDRSCSTEYDTCYEHSHDYDWIVTTTVKDVEIDRVDRQGTQEPPRFTKVQIGEPASFEHSYQNYIKGSENSLFNTKINSNYKDISLQQPYDYYRYNHVIVDGINYNSNDLNDKISRLNAEIGAKKQVNIRIVLTNKPEDFAEVMRNRWLGGKKNELNIFIGTDGSKINWTRVFSWSYNDSVNVNIQSELLQIGTLDVNKIVESIQTNTVKYYSRKQMKDFEYLNEESKPLETWIYVLLFVLNGGIMGSIVYVQYKNKHPGPNTKLYWDNYKMKQLIKRNRKL